jgi:hypothetical protein
LLNLLGGIFSPQIVIRQAPPSPPVQRRIVRRIFTDANGGQAIIEEIHSVPRPTTTAIIDPTTQSVLFVEQPQFFNGLGLNPFDMNFRSSMNDNILEQIMRISMQERGRTGNPPAS